MQEPPKQPIPPKQLRIAVGCIIAIMFVLGLILLAQGFIDTNNYKDKIVAAIEKQTNKKVTIKGSVSVSLLPSPTLFIPGIELRDPDSDAPAPAISVYLVSIHIPVLSLLSNDLRVSSVSLDHPVFEITSTEDMQGYLGLISHNESKDQTASNNNVAVDITEGKIFYLDNKTEKNSTIERINSTIVIHQYLDASGSFRVTGHDVSFAMNTAAGPSDNKGIEAFLLKLNSGSNNSLELKGDISKEEGLLNIKGAFSLKLDNAIDWVTAIKPQEQQLLPQTITQGAQDTDDKSQLGLEITSDWSSHGLTIEMTNMLLKGLASDGAGNLKLGWNEQTPNILANLKFSSLSYDKWSKMAATAFVSNSANKIEYHEVNEIPENPIPDKTNITLNLKVDELHYGLQTWKEAQASASISKGTVTINQFNVKLQGDSVITVFGVVSPSPKGDLRFEGSMETNGKSLRKTLTVFDETAADLPETGFGDFFAHSNLFISSEQLRLSEADVKLGDLKLTGGLVAYFDSNPRIEADIKLKNINFDYFRDVWRETQKTAAKKEDFFLKFDKTMNFDWLKKLQTAIDFKIYVEHFTFLDKVGDNAAFRLYAKNGDFGLYDVNFIYPDDITKGYFKLNVNAEQPSILLSFKTNELNTDYFSAERYTPGTAALDNELLQSENAPIAKADILANAEAERSDIIINSSGAVEPPRPAFGIEDLIKNKRKTNLNPSMENKKHWSEKLIDMSWLYGFSGDIELDIGRVTHKDISLGNFKLKALIGKEQVIFKTLNFSYWGGQCSILGSLYGGKVPGFSVSFTIVDAQVQSLLSSFTNRQNINGQVSISAALASSGINPLSWVSQAEGKMVLIGRNIYVQGLNMQGVVDSVAISRTSSDVLDSVNRAIFNGFTIFSIDGNLNIKDGMIRTPGIGLRTTSTIGNLTGELKMVPWTLELSSFFQFPSMPSETVPTMTVQYSGTPDAGEVKTDTSSLESFVAKRIISK